MKLFNIIATSVLGITMAIGAGLALANKQEMKQARAAEGDAVTTLAGIVSGKYYYIRATVSATNYYWKANGGIDTGTGLAGTAKTAKSDGTILKFTGSGSTWAIQFSNDNYLSITSTSSNGKYDSVEDQVTWTISNASGNLLNLARDGKSFQKNSATSMNFGSYNNNQTNIWLEEAPAPAAPVPEPAVDTKTVTEFMALPSSDNGKYAYNVTGTVKAFKNGAADEYGNLTLTDGVSDLTVYGCTAKSSSLIWDNVGSYSFTNPKDFLTNEVTNAVRVNDTLAMKLIRADYNSAIQGTGIVLSVTPSGDPDPDPIPEPSMIETNLAGLLADTTSGDYKVSYHFEATIAAFNDGATKDQYGNMTLTDGVNTLKVYGSTITSSALSWNTTNGVYTFTNPKDFKTESATNNLEVGDIVEVRFVRFMYNTTIEAQGIILGSSKPSTATSIEEIYTKASGAAVDFHGYYVGFSTGTGPILMDGEYGIVIYDKTHDVSGYTPNVTKLHVVGALTIYHGLYEINASTVEPSSSTSISEPVTYTVTGSETYIHESRHTYVTGTVSAINVAEGKTKWSDDTTIVMSVNSKSVNCFVKAAGLDSTITDKIDAAYSSSTSITLTGFTGWFDNFQVAVNGLFEASGTYTLNQFVTDFFDETNAICTTYEDGVSDYASFKTQLQAVWTDLNSETKYQDLSDTDKGLLRTTVASQEAGASDLQLALARYEFLVLKYKLGDFLERGLITSSNSISLIKNNSVTAIIIVTASIAVISLSGVFFIIRKRKHQ